MIPSGHPGPFEVRSLAPDAVPLHPLSPFSPLSPLSPPASAVTVDSAVARMRALADALPERDGVAVFNRVYLEVTEELRSRITRGWFHDAQESAQLGALFAERYFTAVDMAAAGGPPPACWRPLFQLRRHPGVHPVQFALAGINAHIAHDLPMAVVDTCLALEVQPTELHEDFERVGVMLAGLEDRIREELMPGPEVLHIADPLVHLVSAWSLEQAREAAWCAARALWPLRKIPEVYQDFTGRLDASVGLVSRCLLTPLASTCP